MLGEYGAPPLEATCPTLFQRFSCSAAVCAEVRATGTARLRKREIDDFVRRHFSGGDDDGRRVVSTAAGGLWLLHVARAVTYSSEIGPVTAEPLDVCFIARLPYPSTFATPNS